MKEASLESLQDSLSSCLPPWTLRRQASQQLILSVNSVAYPATVNALCGSSRQELMDQPHAGSQRPQDQSKPLSSQAGLLLSLLVHFCR